ncbi:VOC family protein [Diaphorobacter caeni]|uniref:VOC family protein n=1 Tax=Diaphorobacter caeni TaxID=2784387 RepID=UPI00188F5BB6|nr:VOC family protein [Diaphorobacter caeni]MBF5006920.1 VOC family protein [Diaphorobacter caeni]
MSQTPENLFRVLHHVCIVVKNIDAAVTYYESIGVGPWGQFPSLEIFRDELCVPDTDAFMKMKYRYCNLDNVQLQLCEPGPGGSAQRAFLDAHGEGVFHLGFTVPDLEAAEQQAKKIDLEPWMRGRTKDRSSGFTYFDTRPKGAGVVLEVRANKLV